MRRILMKQVIRVLLMAEKKCIDVLNDPRHYKGMSFTKEERVQYHINGLLPPTVQSLELRAGRCMINLNKIQDDIQKYLYLESIYDRDEHLFYKVVNDNINICLPLIYTPTVGKACQEFGQLFSRPRGMYITINDKKYIRETLCNWKEDGVKAIVVTDGERILGLGDLGVHGMGIPIGKLALYTALAGVPPHQTMPITLDVGTNNEELLNDPYYLGIKQKRVRGSEYVEFIDAFMEAVIERFGKDILIQFEDFANQNAFKLLQRYREKYCTFNDDIQGTASVTLAALLSAENISKRSLKDNVFLFQGAGSAGSGIANLILKYLMSSGCSKEDAISKIYMFDKDGLLSKDRPVETFTDQNNAFAKDIPHIDSLEKTIELIKPTVLIGVGGVPNVFTPSILINVARNTETPYIFALSNPTNKAECSAEDAYKYTNYKCIFACGSPFETVKHENRIYTPSQCNNSYIFPGVALAITMFKIRPIPDDIFIKAANCLSKQLSQEDIKEGRIFPKYENIRNVSLNIACAIADYAYEQGIAHLSRPDDNKEYIKAHWYEPKY